MYLSLGPQAIQSIRLLKDIHTVLFKAYLLLDWGGQLCHGRVVCVWVGGFVLLFVFLWRTVRYLNIPPVQELVSGTSFYLKN